MQIEHETAETFATKAPRMAYIKPILVSDLPSEVQEQIEGCERVFSVHDAEGQQLALVVNRRLAFDLARQNDYQLQAVH